MQHAQIKTLFAYHWAITERLINIAADLGDESYYAESDYGHGSIHKLIFHIIAADHGWRIGLKTGEQQVGLNLKDYPDKEALQSLLTDEKEAWETYLDQVSEKDLPEELTLKTLRGHERSFPLWRILFHLILHGMQHHSELSHMLSEKGSSPGNIDFIFYPD